MKKGIIMIAPVFARPPLFFLLTSWILPPLSLLSPQGKKKKRPTNLNPSLRQHQQSPRNIHTPFFSLFFPRCLLFLWIVLHGSHSAHARPRGRVPAHLSGSTPPLRRPPSHGQKAKAGTWWLTDSEPLLTRFFLFIYRPNSWGRLLTSSKTRKRRILANYRQRARRWPRRDELIINKRGAAGAEQRVWSSSAAALLSTRSLVLCVWAFRVRIKVSLEECGREEGSGGLRGCCIFVKMMKWP